MKKKILLVKKMTLFCKSRRKIAENQKSPKMALKMKFYYNYGPFETQFTKTKKQIY